MTGAPTRIFRPQVFDAALAEIGEKSKKKLYQRDFAAWQYDILGERTYEKMQLIGHDALLSEKERTLIKSANGTAKTYQAARWGMWWVTAFPYEESLAILTAPTLRQVEGGIIAYMKSSWGYVKRSAMEQGVRMPWPGWITEQNEWKYAALGGNQSLALGRVPSASDAVSTFQGLRKIGGRNLILLDEAGGVSRDIFTAIEALMTGGDSRMVGIGNPDRRGTSFYEKFNDPRERGEFNLHTISAYDLPTMTGEKVYTRPGVKYEPEKEALMLKGLTSAKWIIGKERVWKTGGELVMDEDFGLMRNLTGRPDGRFKAKVLGEFPDEDDHTFFPEQPINDARHRDFTPEQIAAEPIILGVDLATTGTDETVVMMNKGGKCRVFAGKVQFEDGPGNWLETSGTWGNEDELSNARRVHAIAKYLGATEVRVDAGGIGAGIATNLERLDEFKPKQYIVLRVDGSRASADPARWANARAQNHDWLRELLADRAGVIDIDYDDEVLKDQLLTVTYELNNKGAVQITPKKEMRSEMHGSPDRLDALIYAVLDTAPLLAALLGPKRGDVLQASPWEMLQMSRLDPGYPM